MVMNWFKTGTYPEDFLLGKLKPILKKGDFQLIKNRRFISVGNLFQQLIEKIAATRFLQFCEEWKILSDCQYGFRKYRSCDTAVANLMYEIASRQSKVITYVFLLDLSSAFFCVKKDQLKRLLRKVCKNDTYNFFVNLLKQRSAYLISDGIRSEKIFIPDDGVPQGGGLSPLFFNLIINAMFIFVSRRSITFTEAIGIAIQGFADDSILRIFATTEEDRLGLIKEAFDRILIYAESVGFKLNPSKTEAFAVGRNKEENGVGATIMTPIGEIELKTTDICILGLRIDDRLTFKPQYKHVIQRMNGVTKDIFELLEYGTEREVLKFSYSKSCGIYLYGLAIQPKWTQKAYSKLQSIVLKHIRIIYGIKWNLENSWSQNDILRLAKWPPIRIQHAKLSLVLLNRIVMGESSDSLFQAVNRHLFSKDGRRFLQIQNPIDEYVNDPLTANSVPELKITQFQKSRMDPRVSRVFPLTVQAFLDMLPNFIRVMLGTPEFKSAVNTHFNLSCWHRDEKDCSLCRSMFRVYPDEVNNFNDLLRYAANDLNTTVQEINNTNEDQINSLLDISEQATFDLQDEINQLLYDS